MTQSLQRTVLYLAIVALGCILGANLYTSVVDAPNWGTALPESLTIARRYFTAANPGTYFRLMAPLVQGLSLLALIACWKTGADVRRYAALALVLVVSADILTFAYFYPRNAILFGEVTAVSQLTDAWREWRMMNPVCSLLVITSLVCELAALSAFERRSTRNVV